jgi:hypothetical protein
VLSSGRGARVWRRAMFGDGALSFREHVMREPLPLAMVHDAVLEFLHGRADAALFGAQAVNAYVDEARMTQEVDILSPRAAALADEIRLYLNDRFKIAVRVREVREGLGYRIFQIQKPKNRHLVDVRPVETLPPTLRVDDVLVVAPAELIANKVLAWHRRKGQPKAFTDRRDLAVLLLRFPELKTVAGAVRTRLEAAGADAAALAAWMEVVSQDIREATDEEEFE